MTTMTTTIELIKRLREETGAGVRACRLALEQANGNYDLARINLLEYLEAEAAKRAENQTSQGRIELYSHGDGRIGVMVETGTETDFTARSNILRNLAHELALQIAAANPSYVREEDIPPEVLAQETEKAVARARGDGKPERLIPRIVEGYLKKYKDERVLLRQAYIRDQQLTIAQLLSQTATSVGENIIVRRFVRWELESEEVN
jgi:elongation factor Ts